MSETFAANLVHFVRFLRARGLNVVPATAVELAGAIDVIGLDRRDDVKDAMRALTIVGPTERAIFDEAFELFFGAGAFSADDDPDTDASSRSTDTLRSSVPTIRKLMAISDDDEQVTEITGSSHAERLGRRDFGDLDAAEQEEVRRMIARMVWRPADAQSRRWSPSRSGVRPDMRRTFRNAVRPEGDLMPLAMSARRPRRRPLVILADVSGSMERYTEMFLYFIHAAQGRLGRVEAFVFATRLSRITREMRLKLPEDAIRRVSGSVTDWSSGTRIGETLEEFNRTWSRRVCRGGALGLIISDGWDTGDPALLQREMARFQRSVHRVVWLNPLAGRAGYSPETRGLKAALPHVDHFLAAASVVDLTEVIRLLETVPSR